VSDVLKTKSTVLASMSQLLLEAQAGSHMALGKLLTAVDHMGPECLDMPELLNPKHVAFRLGVTGPPGAGKSTLINQLLSQMKSQFKKIAVLAVDPTSPISNGAILGDRIRYSENIGSDGVFVRSIGTRGSLGGLSASAYLLLRVFDACGFDIVLIETVGVGQAEVEVMNVADHVTVVLVPESGDSIQAMKAGVLEIADTFLVNKSDRPGAESLKREIEASLEMSSAESAKNVQVLLVSALSGRGVEDFKAIVLERKSARAWADNRKRPQRLREEAKALMRARLEQQASARVAGIHRAEDLRDVFLNFESFKE
jgi:LAO/AO transport system kinase